MYEGAGKYGRHNYRYAGVRASIYYDAAKRHLEAYWEGQDIDPDSGLHHVTKAITSLVVLRDAMIMGMCEDDRPPRIADYDKFMADLQAIMDKIKVRNADKNPVHYTQAYVLANPPSITIKV